MYQMKDMDIIFPLIPFIFSGSSGLDTTASQSQGCRVLEKSHIGAKSDFEIWAFKVFFVLWTRKKGLKEGL